MKMDGNRSLSLLFYRARRTWHVQERISAFAARMGMELTSVVAVMEEDSLFSSLSQSLKAADLVLICGGDNAPSCAGTVFSRLHIPVDGQGEPSGVLRLEGGEAKGYLIESAKQAILLLPDDEKALQELLEPAVKPLARKFALDPQSTTPPSLDYEALVESCADRLRRGE